MVITTHLVPIKGETKHKLVKNYIVTMTNHCMNTNIYHLLLPKFLCTD